MLADGASVHKLVPRRRCEFGLVLRLVRQENRTNAGVSPYHVKLVAPVFDILIRL